MSISVVCGVGSTSRSKITARLIVTAKGRAEHRNAAHMVTQRNLVDTGAVQVEGFGRAHGAEFGWIALWGRAGL